MAIKIFNPTETDYEGGTGNDLIIGNNLDNFITDLGGNNLIFAGGGNDTIITSDGHDIIFGGGGNDIISAGNGNNIVFGGDGDDFIITGNGIDIIDGGDGDDVIFAGDGDDILTGGEGFDYIEGQGSTAGDETVTGNLYLVTSNDILIGGSGNDTFRIGSEIEDGIVLIQGGVSGLDNSGDPARYINVSELEGDEEEEGGEEEEELRVFDTVTNQWVEIEDREMSEEIETDVRLNIVNRPGSDSISTYATTIAGYNAVDTIEFTQSGDFSESLAFTGIERLELSSGVNIILSAEQLEANGESLNLGFLNPGTHIYGVAGGPTESVTIKLEFEEQEFEPDDDICGAEEVEYDAAVFEVDDYSVAELFHNVDIIYDATDGDEDSYVRIDGANETDGAREIVLGSEGVDYVTMRLGDDVVYGHGGNDLLIGHGGADMLDGGEGDDIFIIGGFGSGVQGTTSKADDGNPEWIATGDKHDVIIGGEGTDTLRITTGIGANNTTNGTVLLNDANFQEMEVVQVGGTVGRLNVENTALQLLNDHYYFAAKDQVADLANAKGNNGGTINNVVVDASGVTANGLIFEGNADQQTFIGTTQDDRMIGNSGDDTLTGGAGADTFVFGQVWQQMVTGPDDKVQHYENVGCDITGTDTITDFVSGVDKIELNIDQFTALEGFTSANFVIGSGAVATAANHYLIFDTDTNTLTYDANGNGAGGEFDIAVLTGVTSLDANDIVIAA